MTRRSIVRAACVIAAGLAISMTAPAGAAPTADKIEQAGKPLKLTKSVKPTAKIVHRARKAKVAAQRNARLKAVAARKAEQRKAADRLNAEAAEMSPVVANAKAEMVLGDARGAAGTNGSAALLEIATNEQKTELDRAMAAPSDASVPRAIRTELVVNDQPQEAQPVVAPVVESSQTPAAATPRTDRQPSVTVPSGDAWAQSSLIGKIFIAFGGLLTLASAARMLIA